MSVTSFNPNPLQADGQQSVEINVQGKPVTVPSITVNSKKIVVTGTWIKMAVVHDEIWQESELEDPEFCAERVKASRSLGFRADILSFAQKLPSTIPKYEYLRELESIAAVPLTNFQEWWEKLPQESRKNVRRSQKRGVVVRVACLDDTLVRGLVELNNDSPLRQGRPYSHYGKSFEQVKRDQSDFLDHCDFVGAYLGDELVGFLKIVYLGDTASILQLLPKLSHSDKRPANALLAKAVELSVNKGMSHLIYGMYNYGTNSDSSLLEFKTRHGFEEMLVPRYYIPLTAWGAFCTRAKLYQPLATLLPSGLVRMGIALRSKWYSIRNPIKPV
jgi:hypothetical protein